MRGECVWESVLAKTWTRAVISCRVNCCRRPVLTSLLAAVVLRPPQRRHRLLILLFITSTSATCRRRFADGSSSRRDPGNFYSRIEKLNSRELTSLITTKSSVCLWGQNIEQKHKYQQLIRSVENRDTSGQSNLTTGRIATTHRWFSGICRVAPVCTLHNTCFIWPTRLHNPNGTSIGSAIMSFSLKLPLAMGRSGLPSNTWFIGPTWDLKPNGIGISTGWAVFARLTTVTDRQTDRPRYSICNNRPHLWT